jgi:hypothetical protein
MNKSPHQAAINRAERELRMATCAMLAADSDDPNDDRDRYLAADRLGRAQFDLDTARVLASLTTKATP